MARIPMADKAGLLNLPAPGGHQSGAPGMNWGMEAANALAFAGEQIDRAGTKIHSALRERDAKMQAAKEKEEAKQRAFAAKRQAAEDKLSSAELRTCYRQINEDLENYIKDNPYATDEEVADRIEESRQRFNDDSGQFYDRMSQGQRDWMQNEVRNWQMDSDARISGIRRQARVTDLAHRAGIQEDNYLSTGDFDGFEQFVRSQTEIYSPEMIQAKCDQLPRLREEWGVKQRLDNGDPELTALLQQRDENGSYSNFPEMSVAYREKMIRASQSADASRRADVLTKAMLDSYAGERYSDAAIREMAAGDHDLELGLKRIQQQVSAQMDAEAKQELEADAARFELKLYDGDFPSDAIAAQEKYNGLRADIMRSFAGDNRICLSLLKRLDAKYNDARKPDESYRTSFAYNLGRDMIGTGRTKAALESAQADFAPNVTRRFWFDGSDTAPEMVLNARDRALLEFERWFQDNPTATVEQVQAFCTLLKDQVSDMEASDIVDLFAAWEAHGAENIKVDKSTHQLKGGPVRNKRTGEIWMFENGRPVKRLQE